MPRYTTALFLFTVFHCVFFFHHANINHSVYTDIHFAAARWLFFHNNNNSAKAQHAEHPLAALGEGETCGVRALSRLFSS
jgi:hypothetical protein